MFDPLFGETQKVWTDHTTHLSHTFDCRFFPYDLWMFLTPEDKLEYERVKPDSAAFRSFLLDLPKRYDTKGLVLDRIFSKGSIVCDDLQSHMMTELSDHALLQATFSRQTENN